MFKQAHAEDVAIATRTSTERQHEPLVQILGLHPTSAFFMCRVASRCTIPYFNFADVLFWMLKIGLIIACFIPSVIVRYGERHKIQHYRNRVLTQRHGTQNAFMWGAARGFEHQANSKIQIKTKPMTLIGKS